MKKYAVFAVLAVVAAACGVFVFCACSKGADVEKMLEYRTSSSEYEVTLSVGGYTYGMHLSLGALTGEYPFRDGTAVIAGGSLDGISFDMHNGELRMKTDGEDGFECALSEKDSPAVYAMFASFAVEPGDFIGITENDGGTMDARFGGKYKYTLNLEKETYKPIAISVQTDTDTYKVLFSGAEKQ